MSQENFPVAICAVVIAVPCVPLALLGIRAAFRRCRDALALRLEDRARFVRRDRLNRYRATPDFSVGQALKSFDTRNAK